MIRKDINHILSYKNADSLFYVPAIDTECLTDYCPTRNNCFTQKPSLESRMVSPIMNWIKGSREDEIKDFEKTYAVYKVQSFIASKFRSVMVPFTKL